MTTPYPGVLERRKRRVESASGAPATSQGTSEHHAKLESRFGAAGLSRCGQQVLAPWLRRQATGRQDRYTSRRQRLERPVQQMKDNAARVFGGVFLQGPSTPSSVLLSQSRRGTDRARPRDPPPGHSRLPRNPHTGRAVFMSLAGVFAGTTGSFTDLIDELGLEGARRLRSAAESLKKPLMRVSAAPVPRTRPLRPR